MLTLVAFLVVLGVLIFVHEAGHFLAAKAVGIQVLRFSLGFGRPLLSLRRGETEYWISWIPLGGYVKMAGMEDEGTTGKLEGGPGAVPVDPARAFDRQPLWARIIVIVAGVTMNVVLAFAIYAGMFAIKGVPRLATTAIDSVEARLLPPGAEALATLGAGDRVVGLNGDTVETWNDLIDGIVRGGRELRFGIAGRPEPLVVRLASEDDSLRAAVARALVPLVPARVGFVEPGRPASHAGLRPRDVLLRVNGDTLRSWSEAVRTIRAHPEDTLRFDVLREGRAVAITVVPERRIETDSTTGRPPVYGYIGAQYDPPTSFVRLSPGAALSAGLEETAARAMLVLGFLKGLLTTEASLRDVGGPILIAQMSGQAATLGLDWFLGFMAFLSISLAILNLLPIPVLDGGQLAFLLAELVRRKPLSLELRARLAQIGFVVLIGIILLAITNDVLRNIPR